MHESYSEVAFDHVARAVARATRAACRRTDPLLRANDGGFILVLPATPLPGALRVAESLREYMSAVRVDFESQELHISISSGVATAELGTSDARHLLRRAENAMRDVAEHGGNRVGTASVGLRRDRSMDNLLG